MIEDAIKRFAQGANFAALTTLGKDGEPATQIMWVDADDEHVLINTEIHRAKFHNVGRDPRVALAIWNAEDPYEYVEVRGNVETTVGGEEARAHIDKLSWKYQQRDYATQIKSERVILKIRPTRQRHYG